MGRGLRRVRGPRTGFCSPARGAAAAWIASRGWAQREVETEKNAEVARSAEAFTSNSFSISCRRVHSCVTAVPKMSTSGAHEVRPSEGHERPKVVPDMEEHAVRDACGKGDR